MKIKDTDPVFGKTPVEESEAVSGEDATLQAYFDGELSGAEAKRFTEEYASRFGDDLAAFGMIRSEMQSWLEEQYRAAPRELNIWEKIEAHILVQDGVVQERTPEGLTVDAAGKPFVVRFLDKLRSSSLPGLSFRPQFAGAFAVLVVGLVSAELYFVSNTPFSEPSAVRIAHPPVKNILVRGSSATGDSAEGALALALRAKASKPLAEAGKVLASSRDSSLDKSPSPDSSLTSEDLAQLDEEDFLPLQEAENSRLGAGSPDSGSFETVAMGPNRGLHLSVDSSDGEPFNRWVSLRFANSPLLQNSGSIHGGLRIDGVDIERIKSSRPVRFVASSGRKAPPVIWVAQKVE